MPVDPLARYQGDARLNYKPTEEERLKLASLEIRLRHQPLPQHCVEKTAGTRTLKPFEKEQFEQYVKIRNGPWSEDEDLEIKRNWRDFCTDHDWDPKNPKPFLQMKYKNKEFYMSLRNRKMFMRFLANGLDDRTLYSVFQRFKVLYDKHKISKYSEFEDQTILDYMKDYKVEPEGRNRVFADLAIILKRTRASVWRRYRALCKASENEQQANN
ncbi:uncharacterized protein LOC106654811 [Trichogramma pretiosum]|uniref:uncharacterized protein LOC106654811 n=1 Tax=Trichogramma pretiosum TaxID=7493 RepID=UPI0006C990E9|nr:uncharacterized protein LOC106654811 [Trichogramma pretiosum]